jgi:ubiquinone/menaquinone biosynthesis C-methylase UbiE
LNTLLADGPSNLSMNQDNIEAKIWDDIFENSIENINNVLYDDPYCSVAKSPYLPYLLNQLPKDSMILESGCGIGQWLIFLMKMDYKNLYGVDYAAKTIERMLQMYPQINYSFGSIQETNYQDQFFDAVLSWSIIDHLQRKNRQTAVHEMVRVLKTNGLLYITVPYKNFLHYSPLLLILNSIRRNEFIRNALKLKPISVSFTQFYFTRKELKKLLKNEGLIIKTEFPVSHDVGFFRPISYHSKAIGNLLQKNKNGEQWQGLTKPGIFICNLIKKVSIWGTPDEFFIIAQKGNKYN